MEGEHSATITAFVQSCKDLYGQERCKIIENQGEYLWIIKLDFLDEISAQFSIPRDPAEMMDVFLKGDLATKNLKETFNREISSFRAPSDIGSCMESAENWWKGQSINFSVNTSSPSKNKNKPMRTACKKKAAAKAAEHKEVVDLKHGMKPAQDVIARILWDDSLPIENFTVGYLDRFLGIIDKPFTAFNWDHFSAVDPEASAIPRHRIQYFKYGSQIVWDRKTRFDLIFSSGIGQYEKTLEKVIREENEKMGFVMGNPNDYLDNEESDSDSVEDMHISKEEKCHSIQKSWSYMEGFIHKPREHSKNEKLAKLRISEHTNHNGGGGGVCVRR